QGLSGNFSAFLLMKGDLVYICPVQSVKRVPKISRITIGGPGKDVGDRPSGRSRSRLSPHNHACGERFEPVATNSFPHQPTSARNFGPPTALAGLRQAAIGPGRDWSPR